MDGLCVETVAINENCLFRRFPNWLHLRSFRIVCTSMFIERKITEFKWRKLSIC
jgi:hypothetical protein